MSWNIPLTEAGTLERALPPIWTTQAERAKHPEWGIKNVDRIVFYLELCHESGLFEGPGVVEEFLAAMILESGLENDRFGDAAPSANFGLCFWQADTKLPDLTVDQIHRLRQGPDVALADLFSTWERRTAGGNWLVDARRGFTVFNRARWHAWQTDRLVPADESAWSPYREVVEVSRDMGYVK